VSELEKVAISYALPMRATHTLRRSHSSLTWWNSSLEMVQTISTRRTINSIVINLNIHLPKFANTNAYKLQQVNKISFKYT